MQCDGGRSENEVEGKNAECRRAGDRKETGIGAIGRERAQIHFLRINGSPREYHGLSGAIDEGSVGEACSLEESDATLAAEERRLKREMGDCGVCFVNADIEMGCHADCVLDRKRLVNANGDLCVVKVEILGNGQARHHAHRQTFDGRERFVLLQQAHVRHLFVSCTPL